MFYDIQSKFGYSVFQIYVIEKGLGEFGLLWENK